jgi:5-methylcytosine-specific restriction endonuclease McrA
MPGQWTGSNRRAELPPDWDTIRAEILLRDHHMCRWVDRGVTCLAHATDVDHIQPGDDHSPHNLRALCRAHHNRKSSAEGNAAQARLRAMLTRPKRPHPGLIKG